MDPKRHTLSGLLCFTRTSYPADPLGIVSVEISKWVYRQNEKIKIQTISSDPVYSPAESSTRSACQEKQLSVSPCQASLKMKIFEVWHNYDSIHRYIAPDKRLSNLWYISHAQAKGVNQNKSVPLMRSQIPSEMAMINSQHLLKAEGLHLFKSNPMTEVKRFSWPK